MALERSLGFLLAPVALSAVMLACSGSEAGPAPGAGSPGANPSGGSMAGSGGGSAAGARFGSRPHCTSSRTRWSTWSVKDTNWASAIASTVRSGRGTGTGVSATY